MGGGCQMVETKQSKLESNSWLSQAVWITALLSSMLLAICGYAGLHGCHFFADSGWVHRLLHWLWWLPAALLLVSLPGNNRLLRLPGWLLWSTLGTLGINLLFRHVPAGENFATAANYIFLSAWALSYCVAAYWMNAFKAIITTPFNHKPLNLLQRWGIYVQFAILFTIIGIFFYMKHEVTTMTVRSQAITIKNWPQELNGFKIALLSDCHWRELASDLQRMNKAVDLLNNSGADVVFLLGDYIGAGYHSGTAATPQELGAAFSNIKAPYGVYAVLGNHDYWHNPEEICTELNKAGIIVIEKAHHLAKFRDIPINLIGFLGRLDWGKLSNAPAPTIPENNYPTLVLSHTPDYFATLDYPLDLMFSGHLHGGQLNWPIFGPLLVPSVFGNRYIDGIFEREDGAKLLMSRGIGNNMLQLRINAPPEIVLVTINSPVE